MNVARIEVERDGVSTSHETALDPLVELYHAGPHAHSVVSIRVGTQQDFGRIKISAVVTYECDQTEAVVDRAGMLAFTKACSFMSDGLRILSEEIPA